MIVLAKQQNLLSLQEITIKLNTEIIRNVHSFTQILSTKCVNKCGQKILLKFIIIFLATVNFSKEITKSDVDVLLISLFCLAGVE